jgi:undecaprenyl-diphosphatase
MKKKQTQIILSICLLILFMLWPVLLHFVDRQAIGPLESMVGLASLNQAVHNLTGVHMDLYQITDWLGLVPFCMIAGFASLGLYQWIRRKHLFKVDFSILILGTFYIVVFAIYFFFEFFVVNCRPVLIEGILEPSYPSSTTMLVLCVMPTAIMQLNLLIKKPALRRGIAAAIHIFTAFMVLARLISGVHWFSDIIGGALLSAGLVMMYAFLSNKS